MNGMIRFLILSILCLCSYSHADLSPILIETLYGSEIIEEQLILELLDSPTMQRLKGIDQSGSCRYINKIGPYSRYTHSVGVYFLLKRFNAPLCEQAAGLLHDASHTTFSHTGDWLFSHGSHENSYQDHIHTWYLSQQNIASILERYHMTLEQMEVKDNGYDRLEQDLPDLCADRIEYNLFTGHLTGLLTKDDIKNILDDLHFDHGKWYFEDPLIAAKFARISLHFTETLWGSPWNAVLNELSAKILKRALELHIISSDDIHFGVDHTILERIAYTNDALINYLIQLCKNIDSCFVACAACEADYSCRCKFRGIDPLILFDGTLVRLTSIDPDFAEDYHRIKEYIQKGIHIRWLKNPEIVLMQHQETP